MAKPVGVTGCLIAIGFAIAVSYFSFSNKPIFRFFVAAVEGGVPFCKKTYILNK
jgi:hypothetical protein